MNGTIEEWSSVSGTGIIVGDGGERLRFSAADVLENDTPEIGLPVRYDTRYKNGAVTAVNVLIGRTHAVQRKAEKPVAITIEEIRLSWGSVLRLVSQVAVIAFALWTCFRAVFAGLKWLAE